MRYEVSGDVYLKIKKHKVRIIEAESEEAAKLEYKELIAAEVEAGHYGDVVISGRNAISPGICCITAKQLARV